ncbi:hypothetical protein HDU84_004580 [Entophlyctis sp. JEL0112]|nr:hypothetical protein HDU84_004580 [Entophlyctis sp. JEL0112]
MVSWYSLVFEIAAVSDTGAVAVDSSNHSNFSSGHRVFPANGDVFGQLEPSYRHGVGASLRKLRKSNVLALARLDPAYSIFKDARLGRLVIDWIDFCDGSLPNSDTDQKGRSRMDDTTTVGNAASNTNSNSKPGNVEFALDGLFVPYRSGSTLLNAGVLRLFRHPDTPRPDEVAESSLARNNSSGDDAAADSEDAESGNTLCLLAVPGHWTPQDVLRFIAAYAASISHIRFLRDALLARAMVLVRFRVGPAYHGEPDAFFREFSGKLYDSLDADVRCRVVFVKRVEFRGHSAATALTHRPPPQFAFPAAPDDPNSIFAVGSGGASLGSAGGGANDDAVVMPSSSASSPKANSAPTDSGTLADAVELPTCPVCLDRMDASVTGIVTILCHHSFHCSWWQDASCPVCRYSLTKYSNTEGAAANSSSSADASLLRPLLAATHNGANGSEASTGVGTTNTCMTCGSSQNLWICLICGNVGCGRYQRAHAAAHYTATAHLYSLELETQRVWDYAGDGYVHRLIRTGADGKVVELTNRRSGRTGDEPGGGGGEETAWRRRRRRTRDGGVGDDTGKLSSARGTKGKGKSGGYTGNSNGGVGGNDYDYDVDDDDDDDDEGGIALEYSVLLSSQLESQRRWYEEQMSAATAEATKVADELREKLATAEAARKAAEQALVEGERHAASERKRAEDSHLKEREKLDRRLEKMMERVAALERAFSEEAGINKSLRANQDEFVKRIEQRDKELADKTRQIDELSEQVRDLMFYLETQQKVDASPMKDELQSGRLVLDATGGGSGSGSGSSSSRRENASAKPPPAPVRKR